MWGEVNSNLRSSRHVGLHECTGTRAERMSSAGTLINRAKLASHRHQKPLKTLNGGFSKGQHEFLQNGFTQHVKGMLKGFKGKKRKKKNHSDKTVEFDAHRRSRLGKRQSCHTCKSTGSFIWNDRHNGSVWKSPNMWLCTSRLFYTHAVNVRSYGQHPYRMCDSEAERKNECENEHWSDWHQAHRVAQLSLARDLHSEWDFVGRESFTEGSGKITLKLKDTGSNLLP